MTFINSPSKVFRHLDRVAGWQHGDNPAPVTVEWDLSNRCVLGCQDCHFAHTHVKGPWAKRARALPAGYNSTGEVADPELLHRVLGELARAGVLSVVWSGGGEPTTHPYWTDVLAWAEAEGLQQGMYSLGGLFTQASAAHAARKLEWIVVSLDCADRETYAAEKGVRPERFDAAVQGIRWLAEAKSAVVGVSFLLHEKNWLRMDDMLTLARSAGATYTLFRPAIITSPAAPSVVTADRAWVTEALPALRAMQGERDVEISPERFVEYRDWQTHGYSDCLGIRLNTTITPDGRVWICPQRRGVTPLGDLRTESFADIWARHPRHFAVDAECRVSCRLHPINQTLAGLERPRAHEDFL